MRALLALGLVLGGCAAEPVASDAGPDAPRPHDAGIDAMPPEDAPGLDARALDAARADAVIAGELFVTILSPRDGDVVGAAVVVSYVASGTARGYACALDGAPLDCGPGSVALAGLSDGAHTFEVSVTSAAGGSALDAVVFAVDAAPPVVTTLALSSAGAGSLRADFVLTDRSEVVEIDCRLDDQPFAPCGAGNAGGRSWSGLAAGAHAVEVFGRDALGQSGFAAPAAPPAPHARAELTVP